MGSEDAKLSGAPTIRPFDRFSKARKAWLPEELMRRPEISSNAKLVYARLARFEGRNSAAYPKLNTLAEELGLSWSTVQRAVTELVEAKLLRIKVRRGQHRPNKFEFLDHPWFDEKKPPAKAAAEPENSPDDDPEDPEGGVSGGVPSDPSAGPLGASQGPTGGSLENAGSDSDTHGRVPEDSRYPRAGLWRGPDTHGRVSGEESHTTEESHTEEESHNPSLRKAQAHASTQARTHARALRALEQPAERFALVEGAPPPLAGSSGGDDSEGQSEKQNSAPYHQAGLSNEEDVNSYDIAQRLINGAVAEAKKKHTETKAKNEARRKKSKNARTAKENLNGSPVRNARVRPFEKLWREEMLKKFPDLDPMSIGRWYAPVERKGEDGEMHTGYRGLKEVGQVVTLIQKFDAQIVQAYLVWGIQNWEKLRERFSKAPLHPTVGWLLSMSDSLVPEATATVIGADVEAEAEQWLKDHPGAARLPDELLARLQALPGRGR